MSTASRTSSADGSSATRFGRALVIDRRYESDRFHGSRRIGDCDVEDARRAAPARSGICVSPDGCGTARRCSSISRRPG